MIIRASNCLPRSGVDRQQPQLRSLRSTRRPPQRPSLPHLVVGPLAAGQREPLRVTHHVCPRRTGENATKKAFNPAMYGKPKSLEGET